MRPLRAEISNKSLVLMGVPKRFCECTLSDFRDFKEVKEVKDFVKDYLDNIVSNLEEGKGIFFNGSNGVGKSMLSCIILKEAYRHRYSCQRVTLASYIQAYTENWGVSQSNIEQNILDKYRGVEFLILEEVGKEIDSKIVKPILEDLLRYREEKGFTTLICCNSTLKDFRELYGSSICSLINGTMTTVTIKATDRRKEAFRNLI